MKDPMARRFVRRDGARCLNDWRRSWRGRNECNGKAENHG
jgi:hypothetical protein